MATERFVRLCSNICQKKPKEHKAAETRNVSVLIHCSKACKELRDGYQAEGKNRDARKEKSHAAAQAAKQRMQAIGILSWYDRLVANTDPAVWRDAWQNEICRGPELLPNRSAAAVVNATVGRPWRYYSLVECGASLCLVFKGLPTSTAEIHWLKATDAEGLDFRCPSPNACPYDDGEKLFPSISAIADLGTNERRMAHNLAVINLGDNEYVLAGGMGPSEESFARFPEREGIRFARGVGWPWSQSTQHWHLSDVVIDVNDPRDCAERRLRRIPSVRQWTNGNVALGASVCDFDGRLSLVQLPSGVFRLFARANILEHATAGGRFVQTTTSMGSALTGNWTPWRSIRIRGLPPASADLYFFHVQRNPLDPSSLIAIFPLSQPPSACIALAFSTDGREFSRPVNIQRHRLGWRTSSASGQGPIEWRNEDHPVAGMVLRGAGPTGNRELWIYLHHEVIGTSMRPDMRSRVSRYRLSAAAVLKCMCTAELPLSDSELPSRRKPQWMRSACHAVGKRRAVGDRAQLSLYL